MDNTLNYYYQNARNKASHGGNVLNLNDARGEFNDLLFMQKLIDKIVAVCRSYLQMYKKGVRDAMCSTLKNEPATVADILV